MSADPRDAELATFDEVGKVALWTGLGGPATTATIPRGSLFAL